MVTKSQLHHLKELNKVVLYFNYKRNVTEVKKYLKQLTDQINKAQETVSQVELPNKRFQNYL